MATQNPTFDASVRAEKRMIRLLNDQELLSYYVTSVESYKEMRGGFWETLRRDTAKEEILRRMSNANI